jgi:AcrR family transcriptional regulator
MTWQDGGVATESRTPTLRADAERNRRALIDAAADLFAERGIEVTIAEIRERAGVGQGTVFRHFPTKEHLMAEVMRERMTKLAELATARLDADDPVDGLRDFMIAAAQSKAVDQEIYRLICETNALPAEDERELRRELVGHVDQLLRRAQAAGAIRDDVVAEDILLLETAARQAGEALGGVAPELWRRYLDIVVDGLRTEGAHPLSHPAPTDAQFDAVKVSRASAGSPPSAPTR